MLYVRLDADNTLNMWIDKISTPAGVYVRGYRRYANGTVRRSQWFRAVFFDGTAPGDVSYYCVPPGDPAPYTKPVRGRVKGAYRIF